MDQVMKRTLFTAVVVALLFAACAPVPVATQSSEQDLLPESVDSLPTAQPSQTPDSGATAIPTQTADPVLADQAAQTAAAGSTQTFLASLQQTGAAVAASTESTPNATQTYLVSLQQTGAAIATSQAGTPNPTQTYLVSLQQTAAAVATSQAIQFAQQTAGPPTSGAIVIPTENLPLLVTATQGFDPCTITVIGQNSRPKKYGFPTRLPQLDLLAANPETKGNFIEIIKAVNLRSGPGLSYSILMILRPDSKTKYEIIGGPVYVNYGSGSLGQPTPTYSTQNLKYKWWQIESENKTVTGWIVESSACGQSYFIKKAD